MYFNNSLISLIQIKLEIVFIKHNYFSVKCLSVLDRKNWVIFIGKGEVKDRILYEKVIIPRTSRRRKRLQKLHNKNEFDSPINF